MTKYTLCAWLVLVAPAWAAAEDPTVLSMKGLSGVAVVVEHITETQAAAGFSHATFQADVEAKLRIAGIRVLTLGERLALRAFPYLYVNVAPFTRSLGSCLASA